MWKLISVKNKKDRKERTDGRYPNRVGSIFEEVLVFAGASAIYKYIKDKDGNDKFGYLVTSVVKDVQKDEFWVRFYTKNSIYYFVKYDSFQI